MTTSKVAVVTGSSKGVGLAIVKGLCEQFPGVVYLTARDVSSGNEAVAELNKLGLYPEFYQLDVTCKESVGNFAEFLKTKHGHLDVLVNNASIAFKCNATTSLREQAAVTVAVNYEALRDVCNTLFPILRPHARVVNISSAPVHIVMIKNKILQQRLKDPNLTIDQLNELMQEFVRSAAEEKQKEQGWAKDAYIVSKLGVTALTLIQQRQFILDPRPGILVNAVNPGFVDGENSRQKEHHTPEEGAVVPIRLALLPIENEKPICKWAHWSRINWRGTFKSPIENGKGSKKGKKRKTSEKIIHQNKSEKMSTNICKFENITDFTEDTFF